jgi:deoxyadenosine/deoxycytidine kinase
VSRHYITIAGSIGVGKTTTTEALGAALPRTVARVEVRDIFLSRFYENPKRYAFLNQMAYSLQYLDHASEIAAISSNVVQDRSIYDTHQVFSQWRLETGLINRDEFELLDRIFRIADKLARPTLFVLLEASVEVAQQRILARALPTELGLTKEFLSVLTQRYTTWFEQLQLGPKIRISTDAQPIQEVVSRILSAL